MEEDIKEVSQMVTPLFHYPHDNAVEIQSKLQPISCGTINLTGCLPSRLPAHGFSKRRAQWDSHITCHHISPYGLFEPPATQRPICTTVHLTNCLLIMSHPIGPFGFSYPVRWWRQLARPSLSRFRSSQYRASPSVSLRRSTLAPRTTRWRHCCNGYAAMTVPPPPRAARVRYDRARREGRRWRRQASRGGTTPAGAAFPAPPPSPP